MSLQVIIKQKNINCENSKIINSITKKLEKFGKRIFDILIEEKQIRRKQNIIFEKS